MMREKGADRDVPSTSSATTEVPSKAICKVVDALHDRKVSRRGPPLLRVATHPRAPKEAKDIVDEGLPVWKVAPDVNAALRSAATDRDRRRGDSLVVGRGLKRNMRQIAGESPARHECG